MMVIKRDVDPGVYESLMTRLLRTLDDYTGERDKEKVYQQKFQKMLNDAIMQIGSLSSTTRLLGGPGFTARINPRTLRFNIIHLDDFVKKTQEDVRLQRCVAPFLTEGDLISVRTISFEAVTEAISCGVPTIAVAYNEDPYDEATQRKSRYLIRFFITYQDLNRDLLHTVTREYVAEQLQSMAAQYMVMVAEHSAIREGQLEIIRAEITRAAAAIAASIRPEQQEHGDDQYDFTRSRLIGVNTSGGDREL